MSSLKTINFSNGIRSKEIQENFEYLENALNENRLSVIGSGIMYGLTISAELSDDNMSCLIHVDDGALIDDNGALININDEYNISVEIPENGLSVIHSLYIDSNNNIVLYNGTESTSPSEYSSDATVKYRIGTVTITTDQDGTVNIKIANSSRDRVNIYTDEHGELYLNGIQFSALEFIRLKKPEEPQENDIWLDVDFFRNELYIYQTIDGIPDWRPLRRYDTKQLKSSKYWNPDDQSVYNADLLYSDINHAYFIFGANEKSLHFKSNTNSLSVVIDNAILHEDQYSEISILDVYHMFNDNDENFNQYLYKLGYDEEKIKSLLYEYDTSGNIIREKTELCVGFKTAETVNFDFDNAEGYKRGPYVEATVTHLLNLVQDNLGSSYENYITVKSGDDTFTVERDYIPNKHNLELFLNGLRLISGIDFTEPDGDFPTNTFTINRALNYDDVIIYKITNPITSVKII